MFCKRKKGMTADNFRPVSGSASQHFEAEEILQHEVLTSFCRTCPTSVQQQLQDFSVP